VNGFEIYDRYDFVFSWLTAIAAIGALVAGAPWWAVVLIVVICWIIMFVRHFDEIMGPS
jgi:hypothetical protein